MKFTIIPFFVILMLACACNKALPDDDLAAPNPPTFSMSFLSNDSFKTWIPYRIHVSESAPDYYIYQSDGWDDWYRKKYGIDAIYKTGDTVHYWSQIRYFVSTTNLENNYKITYSRDSSYVTTDTLAAHLRIPKSGRFQIRNDGKVIIFPGKREIYEDKYLTETLRLVSTTAEFVLSCVYTDSITNIQHRTLLYYH